MRSDGIMGDLIIMRIFRVFLSTATQILNLKNPQSWFYFLARRMQINSHKLRPNVSQKVAGSYRSWLTVLSENRSSVECILKTNIRKLN